MHTASQSRVAIDRSADRVPDCSLGYWGEALARFDAAAGGSAPDVAAIEAAIARAASVPARTPFERAAVAALVRLRSREAAPGVPAAWPARAGAYRAALCDAAATDARVRLWCARALADAPRLTAVGQGGDDHAVAFDHVVELVREGAMDVGVAPIVLAAAADPRAPIGGRALAALAEATPPAPRPHALAAQIAARRGEWADAIVAAERATAAAPTDAPPAAAVDAQLEALFQLGRRADAYALAR